MRTISVFIVASLLLSNAWATQPTRFNPLRGAKAVDFSFNIGYAIRIDDPNAQSLFGTEVKRAHAVDSLITRRGTEFLKSHGIQVRDAADGAKHMMSITAFGGRSPGRDCEGVLVFYLELDISWEPDAYGEWQQSTGSGFLGTAREDELEKVLTDSVMKVLEELFSKEPYISGPPEALSNVAGQSEGSPNQVEWREQDVRNPAEPTPAISPSGVPNVLTIEQLHLRMSENEYAAEQWLRAMGMITISGRLDRVRERQLMLVGDGDVDLRISCSFPKLPRMYGQKRRYVIPVEAPSLRKDDVVTVVGRFREHPYESTVFFEDCGIVSVVSAAQAPLDQANRPAARRTVQAPTGTSLPPPDAGYYQCYSLNVLFSSGSCKVGDLQLDGRGNYSSTRGPGGTYVFDPAAGAVSFSGGILNGRMARAKISSRSNRYLLVIRQNRGGLPSPGQTFGTYTFEHSKR